MFQFLKKSIKNTISKISEKIRKEGKEEIIEETPKVDVIKKEDSKEKDLIKEEGLAKGVKITYFVHGTTIDNEKGLATGWSHGELSEIGKEQSKELSRQVVDKEFDVVFCSDLKRAVDSANLTFGKEYKIIEDKRLREVDYGDFTETPTNKFKTKMVDYIDRPFPSGESYREVEKRVSEFLNCLFDNYFGKHVAIVAHQAPQLAMDVLLRGRTWAQAINEDWRLKKQWLPGWDYFIKNRIEIPQKRKEKILSEEKVEGKKIGFLKKIKEGVATKKINEEQFEDFFYDTEITLMENNVAVEVIEKIKEDLKKEIVDVPLRRGKIEEAVMHSLKESIKGLFNEPFDLLESIKRKKPYVICFFGVNGSGKTTTIAKLAKMLKENGKSVVLAASDTFRAASIEQMQKHADSLGIKLIKHSYGSDPSAVAYDAIQHAKSKGIDVVLIDTAGRMHSNTNLIDEMKKISKVANPDLKIFLGESITGNDCVEQARTFNAAVGIDCIILSKADIDEKGGAAISVSYVTRKPIIFLGTGQGYNDLQKFDSQAVIDSLGLQ